MRRFVPLLAAALVIVLAGPAYAFGYRATGFDPNDRSGKRPDISSSTRKVWAASNGHRYLTVTFRTYEDLPSWWTALIVLDSRGGALRDVRMNIWDNGDDGHGCDVDGRKGAFRRHGQWASCRVPLRYVHLTKRIRWKMLSLAAFDVGNPDYAPNDRDWYV
jgi:hypothetical protein